GARRPGRGALAAAVVPAALVCLYALGAFGQALDAWVAAFRPTPARAALLLALQPGAAAWFLADEWLTRGPGAPLLAYPLTKIAFLGSLAGAVALDFERLFFLLILTPVLVIFFVLFGLFSRWTMGATGNPLAGGLANAVILSWAVAATFPLAAA
ncbi:MAG: alpha/beta hydrolase, partial [Rubrimonas sp.]